VLNYFYALCAIKILDFQNLYDDDLFVDGRWADGTEALKSWVQVVEGKVSGLGKIKTKSAPSGHLVFSLTET
jgi:hypothetical protein